MKPFNTLTEAQEWCRVNADGDCMTHANIQWNGETRWTLDLQWSQNLQRFVVNF
jgi:hypothetical protein